MLLNLFIGLREAKVPVSLREYLSLLEGMQADLAEQTVEGFYYLSRAVLVKDEAHIDRFDRVFAHVFKGVGTSGDALAPTDIPEEWLRKLAEKHLTDAEKADIAKLGWDKLFETLRQRLAEQKDRHQGGSKWIGTAGTSPFGAYGYNPEGVRIGQEGNRSFRAVKVWDQRHFKDYDSTVALGTRSIKVALRRLRRFARTGAQDELDLDGTIRHSARQGYIDVRFRPERRNAVKVLLLLDVGGSMDWHIQQAEELFSAAKSEFKHLEWFYFHNCPYEKLWRDNRRRHQDGFETAHVLRTYGPDYRLVIVGDAAMSPYEISHAGGSVEHWNEDAGEVWIRRLLEQFPSSVWLNPVAKEHWGYTHSIQMIRMLMSDRMYPLTLDGLEQAMKALAR